MPRCLHFVRLRKLEAPLARHLPHHLSTLELSVINLEVISVVRVLLRFE